MMTDSAISGDTFNALEHALRAHVNECLKHFHIYVQEELRLRVKSPRITYIGTVPGKWVLESDDPEVVTTGAELQVLMAVHAHALHDAGPLQKLRSKRGVANDT